MPHPMDAWPCLRAETDELPSSVREAAPEVAPLDDEPDAQPARITPVLVIDGVPVPGVRPLPAPLNAWHDHRGVYYPNADDAARMRLLQQDAHRRRVVEQFVRAVIEARVPRRDTLAGRVAA